MFEKFLSRFKSRDDFFLKTILATLVVSLGLMLTGLLIHSALCVLMGYTAWLGFFTLLLRAKPYFDKNDR